MDDSSVPIEAETTESLNAHLNNACHDIENWCSKWRSAVNVSKSERTLLNCSPTAIDVPTMKGDSCVVTQQTKSLCLTIDDRHEYKEHARSVITKAMGTWNHFRSKCSRRWGLPLQAQAFFIKNSNPIAGVLCFPCMGARKHDRFPNFSKQGHSY